MLGALAQNHGAEAREEEVDRPVVDDVEALAAVEDAGGILAFGRAHALQDLAVEPDGRLRGTACGCGAKAASAIRRNEFFVRGPI